MTFRFFELEACRPTGQIVAKGSSATPAGHVIRLSFLPQAYRTGWLICSRLALANIVSFITNETNPYCAIRRARIIIAYPSCGRLPFLGLDCRSQSATEWSQARWVVSRTSDCCRQSQVVVDERQCVVSVSLFRQLLLLLL